MAEIQYLDDLLDVEVPTPDDNDVVYWDAAASLWKSKQPPVGAGGTVERQVRVGSDDCEVRWTGSAWGISTTRSYSGCGYWSTSRFKGGGGMRFLNIYIPNGATIVHAYLKLVSYDDRALENVNSKIRAELDANPLTFSTLDDYLARPRTVASINWDNIPPWLTGKLYQSPDFAPVIREIVSLPAWASGNPVVIFWDDHDDRSTHVACTMRRPRYWEHADRTPPILYIEWTA